ncbi:MAG: 30S ribosomal protein S12 methylthiotransferase RimO [Syntrophobacterales bacterium]|nr:30S ribosomal protein S12 methylthiotransferase RimO [Syntrophobacterales bacterium]
MSLGCPKNLVDTEIMLGELARHGWQVVGRPEEAEVLLVNTCAFIAPAAQEAVDTILELAQHKAREPEKRLVVAGCLPQRYGRELSELLPEVDLFVGVNDFPRLARLLEADPGPRLHVQAPRFDYTAPQPRLPATPPHLAYLKIAEGCSHACTFCTIPRIRGPYRSRPLDTLLAEARELAAAGVRELILVAQDTTAYGREWGYQPGLPELLTELARLPGLVWLRLLYGHPSRVTRRLLEVMAAHPQICPYLDLPIQHAHDAVLQRMGRRYTRADLVTLFSRIREILPQAALRTTVMVGFPGETEEEFAALLDLAAEVRFLHLGVFVYEPEEGTPAARLGPPVPRRTAQARARRLKALQSRIVQEELKRLVGTVEEVLVEGVSQESEYLLSGRLSIQAPEIDGRVLITAGRGHPGTLQRVRLTRVVAPDLLGEIVE